MVLGIDPPCNASCLTGDAQDHGGVLGQQTENQKMRMASTIGGHAHFLILSSMASEKMRKRQTTTTTVPSSLLTARLGARACLSGKSAGEGEGARTGRRTWARPGSCGNAGARPGHPNRAWAMQGGSGEAYASEQGLGDAGMLGRGQGI